MKFVFSKIEPELLSELKEFYLFSDLFSNLFIALKLEDS